MQSYLRTNCFIVFFKQQFDVLETTLTGIHFLVMSQMSDTAFMLMVRMRKKKRMIVSRADIHNYSHPHVVVFFFLITGYKATSDASKLIYKLIFIVTSCKVHPFRICSCRPPL